MAEQHEKSEVQQNMDSLRACAEAVKSKMASHVICSLAPRGLTYPPSGSKLCHFIRHGEGFHNVAQREWRANPDWDGTSEPYTLDTDPGFKFVDAELNDKGKGQATELQQRTMALQPQLLVVSPMRRATLTGLLAFAPHVEEELPVVAHELCHERAGKHTCDKRLAKAQLQQLYPAVDYKLIADEDDPFWGDGTTREPWADLGERAGRFVSWLLDAPESHVAIAAHSAFLLAVFNAALDVDSEETRTWFGTGEMRSVLLRRADRPTDVLSPNVLSPDELRDAAVKAYNDARARAMRIGTTQMDVS